MQKKEANKIEVASYISTPRVTGNNKGKFKKNVLFSLKRASEITGISNYMCTSTFCVRHSFIQNWSVIFYNHVSALQLFDRLLQ